MVAGGGALGVAMNGKQSLPTVQKGMAARSVPSVKKNDNLFLKSIPNAL